MAWTDRLLPGSWRGVPFQIVDRVTLSTGREGEDHVFPGAEAHYAEDASRAPTRCQIDAILIGPDHDQDAAVLFSALAQPGPGELVHPWYGRLWGIARSGEIVQSRQEGGLTRVSISFVESGDPSYPAPNTIALDVVDVRAGEVESASSAAFAAAWSAVSETSYVVGQAQFTLRAWAARVEGRSGVVAALVAGLGDVPSIAATELAALLVDVYAEFDSLRGLAPYYGAAPTEEPDAADSDEEQVAQDNALAFARLSERCALARAATVCAETEWAIWDDAAAARDELEGRLLAEATVDQSFAGPALSLRAAVIADLDERMTDLARRRQLDLVETTDVLSLAWRLYGDPSRADEVAALNDAEHPAFLSGALTVLSE